MRGLSLSSPVSFHEGQPVIQSLYSRENHPAPHELRSTGDDSTVYMATIFHKGELTVVSRSIFETHCYTIYPVSTGPVGECVSHYDSLTSLINP